MTEARPVARLVQPVFVVAAALVAVISALAIAGVALSFRSVTFLTDDLQPAATADADVLRDMLNMETGVRAWINMGQPEALEPYQLGLSRVESDEAKVRAFASSDPDLLRLVRAEQDAARAWRTQYAAERVQRSGGAGTISSRTFDRGKALFDRFRAAQQDTGDAFDARIQEAKDSATQRLDGTILVVALLLLVGGVLLVRQRRRLMRELGTPLTNLEAVVNKMTAQDASARAADDDGPSEVRAVGRALNNLAASQDRARAVETQIQQELRVLDSARADFVANVSHELRTPLTTLNGYLELVAEEFEGAMDPHHERMVDAARRNVSRLRMLIDDLLTLSKAESTSTDLERVDLSPVVRDVVGDIRLNAARRGITITFERDPKGPALALADKAMLFRAFLNVLTNAVKFSPDNSTVEVTLTTTDKDHVFRVRDHGIGIPAAELDQLGTRFFRASNAVAGEIAGTGLGIRIVQTIVDRHAGTFVIDSVEGDGTTVTITVPSQAPAVVEQPGPVAPVDALS